MLYLAPQISSRSNDHFRTTALRCRGARCATRARPGSSTSAPTPTPTRSSTGSRQTSGDAELDRSKQLIEDRLGRPCLDFAYPKALPPSPAADVAVRSRFRSAALAGTRANRPGRTDVHRPRRSPIQHSDGMQYFEKKVAGGMALEGTRCGRAANRWRYRAA